MRIRPPRRPGLGRHTPRGRLAICSAHSRHSRDSSPNRGADGDSLVRQGEALFFDVPGEDASRRGGHKRRPGPCQGCASHEARCRYWPFALPRWPATSLQQSAALHLFVPNGHVMDKEVEALANKCVATSIGTTASSIHLSHFSRGGREGGGFDATNVVELLGRNFDVRREVSGEWGSHVEFVAATDTIDGSVKAVAMAYISGPNAMARKKDPRSGTRGRPRAAATARTSHGSFAFTRLSQLGNGGRKSSTDSRDDLMNSLLFSLHTIACPCSGPESQVDATRQQVTSR